MAIKVLLHSSADEPAIARELATAAAVDHPNVVATLHWVRLAGPQEEESKGAAWEEAPAAGVTNTQVSGGPCS